MQKVIDFRPFDFSKSDFNCAAGEVQMPTNLISRSGGAYCASPAVGLKLRLPQGHSALALHSWAQSRRIISICSGVIYWGVLYDNSCSAEDGARYRVGELAEAAAVSAVSVEVLADKVVIAAAEGLAMLVWRADGYDFIAGIGGLPIVEFGLQRVGALACTDVFDSDGLDLSGSGAMGSGASTVHPTAEQQVSQHAALFKAVGKAYTDVVEAQISAKGYFHQPFFVRYALRLSDGSHVMPSPPVLMLPTVLPPCIGVNVASSRVGLDLSSINFFELRYRFGGMHGGALSSLACAIDVFVSQPVPTFDLDSIDRGYLTNYSQQIAASNAVNHDRSPSRGDTDPEAVFEGHYSTGADNYIDHYLDASLDSKTVLALRPNSSFNQQICSVADFYLVASIPLDGLEADGAAFERLIVDNTDRENLASLPKLTDNHLSHCSLQVSAMTSVRGRLMAAVSGVVLPAPFPIAAMGAAWGPGIEGDAAAPVKVTVFTKIGSSVRSVSCVFSGGAAEVCASFPRYVFYPDRHAFMMAVSAGCVNYMLPLTPHPSLYGAYWCGGYSSCYVPDGVGDSALPLVADCGCPVARCCRMLVSEIGNPLVFADSEGFDLADAEVEVVALVAAMKAPKQGSFGKYNFYAFASRGLWMLECDGAAVKSGQLISRHPCSGASAVALTDSGVAWSGSDGVFIVSGSDVVDVSSSLAAVALDVRALPCSKALLDVAKMDAVVEDLECLMAQCLLASLHGAQCGVVAFVPGKEYALAYDMEHKQWSVFSAALTGKIKSWDGNEWLMAGSDVVNLPESTEPVAALLITRPLTLSSAFDVSQLVSVEILGYFRHRSIGIAVYGSADMHQWCLLSSSRGPVVRDFDRTPYRHYRIAVAAMLTPPADALFGAKITYR